MLMRGKSLSDSLGVGLQHDWQLGISWASELFRLSMIKKIGTAIAECCGDAIL